MEDRAAVTIRIPVGLLERARRAKLERESLNELVVGAIEREVRRRQALGAHEEIVRIRGQIKARTGNQPDATPLIRELREGRGRRG